MNTAHFYQSRADLALSLADRLENAGLRKSYLALWKNWTALATGARQREQGPG